MPKAPPHGRASGGSRTLEPSSYPIRCTEQERTSIKAAADRAGLGVGAFLRAAALGDAGPRAVRRPPIERKELARLLGHLGKVGSNLNQFAHAFNRDRSVPALAELTAMRQQVKEPGALKEMEAVASGTRSTKPFYHGSINTKADERLTDEQRTYALWERGR